LTYPGGRPYHVATMGKTGKKPDTVQVVQFGDTHVGSTMGLCPIGYTADDGNEIHLNRLQEVLLDHWSDFWKRRFALRLPIVVLATGDLIDGNHHGISQLWTTDEIQMRRAFVQVTQPYLNHRLVVDKIGVRGTPSHVGVSGKWDNDACEALGFRKIAGQSTSYHFVGTIAGVRFDIAHHGPSVGKYPHTRSNIATSYGRGLLSTRLLQGQEPPEVIIRSHVHRKIREYVTEPVSGRSAWLVVTPAWQWATEFKHKIDTIDDIADVGGTSIIIENRRVAEVLFDTYQTKQSVGVPIL
jgi:hypothetical protein